MIGDSPDISRFNAFQAGTQRWLSRSQLSEAFVLSRSALAFSQWVLFGTWHAHSNSHISYSHAQLEKIVLTFSLQSTPLFQSRWSDASVATMHEYITRLIWLACDFHQSFRGKNTKIQKASPLRAPCSWRHGLRVPHGPHGLARAVCDKRKIICREPEDAFRFGHECCTDFGDLKPVIKDHVSLIPADNSCFVCGSVHLSGWRPPGASWLQILTASDWKIREDVKVYGGDFCKLHR